MSVKKKSSIYESLICNPQKKLAVLIDPDKASPTEAARAARDAESADADFILAGGSHISKLNFEECLQAIKDASGLPLLIFPGSSFQLSPIADALLFLSLISGRNAELLIGQQVQAAPLADNMGLECIATGYMLFDGGAYTSVQYMSQSFPLPSNKAELAVSTALAGKMLGMHALYLEAGSGAKTTVASKTISLIKEKTALPLFVGGGINTPSQAKKIASSGADIIVVGTAFEKNPSCLSAIKQAIANL